jgi:cadmium resistance protein CadD (predicted permease)
MVRLGIFTTRDGKNYDCQYIPDEKMAQAIGPLPDHIGVRGVAFSTRAESEQEAREKLPVKIGPGNFR